MASSPPLAAAAASHVGLRRDHNEDRYHCDPARGVYIVIDGVGGQAAGEQAAEIALEMLRARLERETGRPADRLREAITLANNEIIRLARTEPAWTGMACVLTAAIVRDGCLTVGHVGDTRLYVLRAGDIRKLTHDHSPIGEREDRGELSEDEAMRHPRRNEIFRDLGSTPHSPGDEGFVEIFEEPFDSESAIVICTDGLSDLVASSTIADLVHQHADDPEQVVGALVDAANDEGGKDNITVIYAAGPQFASRAASRSASAPSAPRRDAIRRSPVWPRVLAGALGGCLLGLVLAYSVLVWSDDALEWLTRTTRPIGWARTWVVGPGVGTDAASIDAALSLARPGDRVIVEPGVYDLPLAVPAGVELSSRQRLQATLRPRDTADGRGPGLVLRGDARLVGFRIVGTDERRLGVGVLVEEGDGEITDVEITGAREAAVVFGARSRGVLRASRLVGNHGTAVVVEPDASPRLLHNVIAHNGPPAGDQEPAGRGRPHIEARPQIEVQNGGDAVLVGNIIEGGGSDPVAGLSASRRAELPRENALPRPPSGSGARRGGATGQTGVRR